VGTAVHNIHHGNGQDLGVGAAEVAEEGQSGVFCSGLSDGHGYAKDGVGAQF